MTQVSDATTLIDPAKARPALKFFRVMATVVGIGLLILCLEMILRYGFDNSSLDWWPQVHGVLYVVYVASVANLGFKMRWPLTRMVLVMLAGVVPFLSFFVEHREHAQVDGELTAIETGSARQ